MNFTELELNENLLKGILEAGYETCTPVQEQVLSGAMQNTDLYVQSQTGTGKTAAYLITIFQQLLSKPEVKGKKALIMVPTRELAVQVEEEAKTLGKYTELKCASFYGGVGYEKQQRLLEKGVDILIGTPGRVIDLQENKKMDISDVAFLVVDEADRMFDMGFYPDLRTLIKVLPDTSKRQTMLFSATLNTYVKNLSWEYTDDAKEITIECENITVSEIDQMLLHVSSDEKMKLLLGTLDTEKPETAIIFCNTKRTTEVIAKRLQMNDVNCEFIIGDLPQSKRLQLIDSLKQGKIKCLVATDIAARGIDVNDLSLVINYDLPNEAENYVHRIGRTARAGKSGKAYTFCSEQDVYNLPAIERYIEMSIPSTVADSEMMKADKSEGIYIKIGNYDDENGDYKRDSRGYKGHYNSNHHNSRQNNDRRNSRNGSRNENYRGHGKNSGSGYKKFDSRNEGYKKNYSSHGKKPYDDSKNITQDLSTLSFDERMKLYKEKYGGNQTQSQNAKQSNNGKKRNSYAQKNNKNKNNSYNAKDGKKPQNEQPKNATPQKKLGIFDKIKSIFFAKKD